MKFTANYVMQFLSFALLLGAVAFYVGWSIAYGDWYEVGYKREGKSRQNSVPLGDIPIRCKQDQGKQGNIAIILEDSEEQVVYIPRFWVQSSPR